MAKEKILSHFGYQVRNLKWFMSIFGLVIVAINVYYILKIRLIEERVVVLTTTYSNSL